MRAPVLILACLLATAAMPHAVATVQTADDGCLAYVTGLCVCDLDGCPIQGGQGCVSAIQGICVCDLRCFLGDDAKTPATPNVAWSHQDA